MPDQLTENGLEISTYDERFDDVASDLRTNISENLDLGTDTDIGQFTKIIVEKKQSLAELIQALYSSNKPSMASGVTLAALARITGTVKQGATFSKIPIDSGEVLLDAATTLPVGSVAHVVNNPNDRFVTDVEVNNPAGTQEWVPCAFTAESSGPVQALSGTLTVIAESQPGWAGVNNIEDAIEGQVEESDTDLRVRRENELYTGDGSVGSIKSYLLKPDIENDWPGVTSAVVLENFTDEYDSDSIPPHSIYCIIQPGSATNDQIGAAIYRAKPGGIRAFGPDTAVVTDSEGNPITISWKEVDVVEIYIEIDLLGVSGQFAGIEAVKTALKEWGDNTLTPGDFVRPAQITGHLIPEVSGIQDILEIRIGAAILPTQTTNYVILPTEIAEIDTGRIEVSVEYPMP